MSFKGTRNGRYATGQLFEGQSPLHVTAHRPSPTISDGNQKIRSVEENGWAGFEGVGVNVGEVPDPFAMQRFDHENKQRPPQRRSEKFKTEKSNVV
jgi:hypothetical protein